MEEKPQNQQIMDPLPKVVEEAEKKEETEKKPVKSDPISLMSVCVLFVLHLMHILTAQFRPSYMTTNTSKEDSVCDSF
jgi:hypothetical protein